MQINGITPVKQKAQIVVLLSFFLILLTCLPVVNDAAATENVAISMDELIEIALTHNPQIDTARHQQTQRSGQLTQAKSGYLPHVGVNGDYNRVAIKDLEPKDEDNVGHAGAKATQLIYDFGKTTGAIDAGQSNLEASEANLNQVSQDIVFLVKQAYYAVLEKDHLIKVAQETVTNYEQHLERAKAYFEAGVRTRIDVVNAEVELSSSRLRLLQSRYNLKTARVELEQILGIVPNNGHYTPSQLLDSLDKVDEKMPPLPPKLDELLNLANEQRQDVRQQKAFIKTAEAILKQADSGYWPSIGATAGLDGYDTDLIAFQDQWNIGVGLTWELFSGFKTQGEVAEANGLYREARSRLNELELFVTQEVTDSYIRADERHESVKLNMKTVNLAAENLELASERYKAGLNDMIEYNDAQLRYTTARGDLVSSYFSYLTALARVDRAIGTPTPVFAEQTTD